MTQVISILNQKGGVGKTTLCTNLGMALQQEGRAVLLVDADPQGSLRDWNAANEGNTLPVVGLDRETLAKDLEAIKDNYEWVLIDGAPQSAKLAGAAVRAADQVLIPVTPSPYDVWACADLVEIIQARQAVTDGTPPAYFVISRARKGTKLGADVRHALADYKLACLKGHTIQREIYPQTAADGLTVYHTAHARDAIAEITAIRNELVELCDGFHS